MKRVILYRTRKTPMLLKISVGFFLGILFGFIVAPLTHYYPILDEHIMPFLEFVGKLFLRLLSIIIIPLVFSSLVAGVASIGDTKKLGLLGLKTFALFFVTTLTAAGIALLCAHVLKAGAGMNVNAEISKYSVNSKPLMDTLLTLIPSNPLASILRIDIIHIIIAALITGIVCIFIGNTGKKIEAFFAKVSEIMQYITHIVMWFAPAGVFALIATAAAEFGLGLIAPFARIIGAVYSSCLLQSLIVYSLIIMLLCHKSPLWFFKGMREAAITAFVTRSSSITLPITLSDVRENLGVSNEVSSFVLPLGATLNMDGTVIYEIVGALFVARAYGIPLTMSLQVSILTAAELLPILAGLIIYRSIVCAVSMQRLSMSIIIGSRKKSMASRDICSISFG